MQRTTYTKPPLRSCYTYFKAVVSTGKSRNFCASLICFFNSRLNGIAPNQNRNTFMQKAQLL